MSRKAERGTKTSVSGISKVRSLDSITEYVLKANGLKILYVHVPNSPAVTTNIVYHVGSQHEGMGETGLAHMLEHMNFKPTTTNNVSWKDLEDKGALLNATTSLDRTMYYFNLPNAYFEDMLRVEADRMRNVAFTEKEFEPERTNVLSEYEMYNSQPEAALEWSMVASAFQAHGYKHDTIGFRNDIENYTLEKLKHFYDRHYWPDNATLVVVGDLGERRLLESVKKIFGRIKAGKKEKYVSTPEPKQEGVRRVTILRKTPVRVIHVAFKVPPALLRDWTTLNLLLCYLTDSKSSPLHKKLIDTGLASSLYGGIYPTKDPYLASIVVYAAENGSYAEIERIIFKTLAELSKVKLPKKAVHETQQYLYSRLLFSRDGTFKIAGALAEFVATGDWTRYLTVLNEIRSITSEEMRKVTAEYMQPSKAIIGTLENPS